MRIFPLMLLTALAIDAHASNPDTFDPAKRDPKWLVPEVREAQQDRALEARRIVSLLAKKCPALLARIAEVPSRDFEKYERAVTKAVRDAGLKPDDVETCWLIRREYFEFRDHLIPRVASLLLGHADVDLESDFETFDLWISRFERLYGQKTVAALDSAAVLWHGLAQERRPLSDDEAFTLLAIDPASEPGESFHERVRRTLLRAIRKAATPENIQAYVSKQLAPATAYRARTPDQPLASTRVQTPPAPKLDRVTEGILAALLNVHSTLEVMKSNGQDEKELERWRVRVTEALGAELLDVLLREGRALKKEQRRLWDETRNRSEEDSPLNWGILPGPVPTPNQ